jgi:hypothetical protein
MPRPLIIEDEPMRAVNIDGYILRLYGTNQTDWRGQTKLAYKLESPTGELIFDDHDFSGSPMHADDSDETIRSLLGFLTLRKGDTDAEYFDRYTERQLEFAANEAEALGLWSLDDGPEFIDVEV